MISTLTKHNQQILDKEMAFDATFGAWEAARNREEPSGLPCFRDAQVRAGPGGPARYRR